jgi:hypothetical protein
MSNSNERDAIAFFIGCALRDWEKTLRAATSQVEFLDVLALIAQRMVKVQPPGYPIEESVFSGLTLGFSLGREFQKHLDEMRKTPQ